jgi:hypothetical protein
VQVKNLLHRTKGAAAGCPPKNIKIIKLAIKSQKKSLYNHEMFVGIEFGVTLKNGIINKIRIAANILITPPSLLGQARKMA